MDTSIVSFTPANVVALGKTASDKRMSVATNAGTVSTMYIAAGKGKAAVMARENLAGVSIAAMGKGAADGNYRPLAEALAFTLGESINIAKLADLDSVVWSLGHRIANLKDEGYSAKTGKPTAALTALTNANLLATTVLADCANIIATRVEARRIAKSAIGTAQVSSVTA